MPRKYEPEAYTDWEWDRGYPAVRMRESSSGEWVKLQTFIDTTAMLTKANQRLQNEINLLKESNEKT